MRKLLVFGLPLVLIAGAGWYWHASAPAGAVYREVVVKRGDVVTTISATGTLEPQEVVDVGAQVAGLIVSFGKDADGNPVDYRSPVKPDMVLALIDDSVYKADVDSAVAELAQSNTAVSKGEADLAQANAKLLQAQNNWKRADAMGVSGALSQNDHDMYLADFETAKANVAVAQTEIAQAKSGILLAQASLSKAQRNLEFCTIRSPVEGVIIDRRVNIGQTVVSSLNAPSLFLIAKDLKRMQIWVAVNEADIGRIVPGAPVTFTCDAFPDRVFPGKVGKIRLNATMTQNVVMYTVEVEADNADNVLLPYLTAKLQFEVAKQINTLMVPNIALRWNPLSTTEVAPGNREVKEAASSKEHRGTLWIKEDEYVRPVQVMLGPTDGTNTAVSGENLHEGDKVVTNELNLAGDGGVRSPFLPPPRR